jgi:hypothetical protein
MKTIDLQITNRFDLEMADLELVPACRKMAVEWLGQMAISFAVSSFVDDFMFKSKGQEMRDTKRHSLTQVLAFCMENGYTAQNAQDEMTATIEKTAHSDFKSKSISQEQLEILVACGEDEESMKSTIAEENAAGARIHNARKNRLKDFMGDIRGQMDHILATARGIAEPDLSSAPAWLIKLIATKILGAEEQHRKYLIRGITQGHLGNAGQLTLLNATMKVERMEWVHLKLAEMERESQFNDSGVIERGHAGDNENKDITY